MIQTRSRVRSSWLITLGLGTAAVAYLLWGFFPGMARLKELRAAIQKNRDFIAQADSLGLPLRQAEQDLRDLKSYSADWKDHSPRVKQLPELFAHLNDLAKQSHVGFARLDPQPAQEFDSLSQIPVSIGASGGFADLMTFLRGLEASRASIWISDLKIEGPREAGKKTAVEIKLEIFAGKSEILN